MSGFDAVRFAEDVKEGVEGVEILVEAVLVHGEEGADGAVGLADGGVALGEDSEGFGRRAEAEGAHAAHEGPGGVEVAHAGRDVDGVVEGGGGVGVGREVAVEVFEE